MDPPKGYCISIYGVLPIYCLSVGVAQMVHSFLPQFGKELTHLPHDTGKYFVPLFRINRVLNAP
jgi:hypothetical protein